MSPPRVPPAILERHRVFNRNSEQRWAAFAGHRAAVMRLLGDAAARTGGGRLCVLGAGNCNDLDLGALVGLYREVHLADVDDEALAKAPARQGVSGEQLTLHAPFDLTGALPLLPTWERRAPTGDELARLGEACAAAVVHALPGEFDVVLSACVLSQLMHSCRLALGAKNPALPDIAHVVAVAHARILVKLCRPGGTALLATDTTSSETYPLVELFGEQPPARLLEQLDQSDALLSGTSPTYLRRLFARDPELRGKVARTTLVDPWLWGLGDDVTLLAYALVIERSA